MDGLGDKAGKMIVAEASYEVTDPTIDSQIVTLKASGADTFLQRHDAEVRRARSARVMIWGWRPAAYFQPGIGVGGSGADASGAGKVSRADHGHYLMDPVDPQWQNDPRRSRSTPPGSGSTTGRRHQDYFNVAGYLIAGGVVHVLKACGDDSQPRERDETDGEHQDLQVPMNAAGGSSGIHLRRLLS